MDQAHSLLLNEQSLSSCAEPKRAAFVYEWLRYLDKILPVTQRADLKQIQPKLIQQLESRLTAQNGPPSRKLLSRCIARLYVAGDSYQLFGTINSLNDSLKSKDDGANSLSTKLTALTCLAALYDHVGRLVGRTYEESFTIMVKWLKSAESQGRAEILCTLSHLVTGLGPAASNVHKELYKTVRPYLTDRVPSVRIAAINCICSLIPFYTPLFTSDLEAACTLAVKSLDGSSYETRVAVAKLFSTLLSTALQPPAGATMGGKSNANVPIRPMPVEDALQLLATGFLRGGIGGFLKGSGAGAVVGGQKEVRVGVTMGYVELVREMGATWLERNLGVFCKHMVELAAKSGGVAYTNNSSQATEAVLLRKCVSYVLRSTLGALLSEQTQITACKYLGALLAEHINQLDYVAEPGVEPSLGLEEFVSSQAAMVVLLEVSALVRQIGTAVTPLFVEASGIMEPIFECLLHPVVATRASTAWCLRCVTLAVPGQLTPLIDRCISRLEHMKASPDAISGYSLALASLIAASADCNLGIPHGKPKQVMQCAEDMLKTATQQSRLAVAKINAGWTMLHSLVSIGSLETRDHLARLCQLWRAAFPRSAKEADAEKTKGDAFTWQCALESRAGALSVMVAAASQKDLATDDVIKSMLVPLECSLVMMSQVGSLIRSFGNKMRQLICVVRVRAYRLLMLLPPKAFENMYAPLLRELVADLTLSDNVQSAQWTSVCSQVCSGAESVLLTPWLGATDESMIEDAIQSPSGSIATLENDITSLVSGSACDVHDDWPEEDQPQNACLDTAVLAYGRVFSLVPAKHKLQITEHFTEVIKNCKQLPRQQAIQQNVICAMAGSFRSVCEQRGRVDSAPLQNASFALLVGGLCSPLAVTRCVAAEGIGRLAQAVGDAQYVASVAQFCFDKLKAARDAASRAGYALALGSLHRHVGSLGSGQHLNTGVSIVLALAQDANQPLVQSWSLVSLALIAETGGGMFRGYVEPVLAACLTLLLNTLSANVEVVLGIGKLLSALMTCVGPELGCSGTIEGVRESLLAACAIQLCHPDPLVRSEAMAGLQQMHLYAPRHVHLSHLVQDIGYSLSSRHLCVRKASVCCLRQLVQREAREVREHAQVLVPQGVVDEGKKLPLPDTGLEGALFAMLDTETQPVLRTHLQETIISLVQATSGELLSQWLSLCKEILATSSETARSTLVVEEKNGDDDDDENEGGDDDATLQGARSLAINDKGKLHPRWPTRVFATQVVQRLMSVCDTERAHLDLALAKELQMSSNGRCDYLVLHLSDLVRMSFMGATSDNTPLRLAGLQSLQEVINRFSAVPEPEFPGHVILEQFQAQVGAALRPAFSEDTPSDVTAAACQVCSTWIGSGVARDLNDLRRVHHLLVSSLNKLRDGSTGTQLYSEAAATLEKLSILKAWAEVYVTAEEQQKQQQRGKKVTTPDTATSNGNHDDDEDYLSSSCESLLSLVRPELTTLVGFWLAALHDAAALSLPSKYADQLPPEGGAFYKAQSAEVCREYYRSRWPPLLLATAVWLRQNNFELPANSEAPSAWPSESASSRFHVMMGLAVEALCSKTAFGDDVTIQMCVRAITNLLSCEWCQHELMSDVQLSIELCNVLHRLILTRDCLSSQQHCIDCASAIMAAAQLAIKQGTSDDMNNGNVTSPLRKGSSSSGTADSSLMPFRGDEGKDGLKAGSLSYALIELCLCLFVRQMPQINSAQMKSRSVAPLHLRRFGRLPADSAHLVRSGIQLMVQLPSLCCSAARPSILPVILYLLIGFIRESARIDENSVVPELPAGHLTLVATTALQALRSLAGAPPTDATLSQWCSIMRSALYSILLLSDGSFPMDNCVVMLSAVVVASVAPRSVVLGHSESVQRLVRLMGEQIRSENTQVVVKSLQSLSSLLSRRDVSAPFARHLAPTVIQCIRPYVSETDAQLKAKEISDEELTVVQEAFKVLELLAGAADEKKRLSAVSLLTQSLSRLLVASTPEEWRQLPAPARRLHEWAIGRLNAVAPLWPAEFKKILAAHPQLKTRLEAALLLQANRQSQANAAASLKQSNEASKMAASAACQQPTIKLTMDFNAFGKSS